MSDLRQHIVDASVELIRREGVRELSFRKVARQAKVSHQAPYHYFKDHRAILHEIARQGFVGLAEAMRTASAKHSNDSLDALCASGEAYIQFARKNVGHFRVMFQKSLLTDEHGKSSSLPEGEEAYAVLVTLASRAIQDGHGQGLSLQDLSLLCWTNVHGIATLLADGGVDSFSPGEAQKAVITSMKQLLKREMSKKRRD